MGCGVHMCARGPPTSPKGVEMRSFGGSEDGIWTPRIRDRTHVSRTRHILILFWTPFGGPTLECGIWPYVFLTAISGGTPKRDTTPLEGTGQLFIMYKR